MQNFNKLWPEKYDFDIYKGFCKEEMPQIHQISKKNNPNLQILMMSLHLNPILMKKISTNSPLPDV